jgi:hypothetical protein
MASQKDLENSNGKMEAHIKDNLKVGLNMAKAFGEKTLNQVLHSMMENSNPILNKDKGLLLGKMGIIIKVVSIMMTDMDTER